jgi:predicted house-cleaning noncanonical NTP pyrophosphatase (MazG superfamily)
MKTRNKLVRDRIPEIIQGKGRECRTATMSDGEYKTALRAKLLEEAQEVLAADPDQLATELADVYDVLDALLNAYGISRSQVQEIQGSRRAERGGFEGRICLLWVGGE